MLTNVFRKSSINERLPDKTAAIKSVFRNNGFISPVVGITIKSLTGKEIITEINNENHDNTNLEFSMIPMNGC
jgi:hypothetical protein